MTNHEPLFVHIKHERLTHAEKRAMKAVLIRHMRSGAAPSPYAMWGMVRRHRIAFVGTAIGAVLFGGTVSYAAESALPGDMLYEVKVSLNERAKVALARTEEAQAMVQAELADRRLKEAEKLALLGALSSDKKVLIEEKLATHLDQMQVVLAQVETKDEELAYDLESDLRSSIDAHRSVIAAIRDNSTNEESDQELNDVDEKLALRFAYAEPVPAAAMMAMGVVEDVSVEPTDTTATVSLMMAKTTQTTESSAMAPTAPAPVALVAPSIDGEEIEKMQEKAGEKRAKAVQKIEDAREEIGSNQAGLERLLDAEALLAEGDSAVALGDYVSAREYFEQAARRAYEGKRVSELERELKIKTKTKTERTDGGEDGRLPVSGQSAHVLPAATESVAGDDVGNDSNEDVRDGRTEDGGDTSDDEKDRRGRGR